MKVPPIVIFALPIPFGWGFAQFGFYRSELVLGQQLLAATLFLAGVVFLGFAVFGFRLRRTTVDPMRPEGASALVTDGIYALSRNPMYVGMAACSVGVCIFFGWWVGLLMVVVAIGFITQFQIKPEERILADIFGEDYAVYRRHVRRWL